MCVSEITELIFGNDFFKLVASQTNLYYQQNEKSYKKYDKALKWTDVTNNDMKTFLGLIILMGQIKSHWREYWSTDPLFKTPIFPKIMTRFKQIMTFLHFNNNLETPLPADRISKLNLFWIIFYQNFSRSMYPNKSYHLVRQR